MRLTCLAFTAGLYANIEHLLEIICNFIRDNGPDAPIDDDPLLIHQLYMLLCHTSFILQYGPLHDQFAVNDVRQKMFFHSITDPIRLYYSSSFRNLSDKHRVDEDDHWTQLHQMIATGSWNAAIVEFAKRNQDEIKQITDMASLVDLYLKDTEYQIFGSDLESADKFLKNVNSPAFKDLDYPVASMHSYLLLDVLHTLKHRAEVSSAYHVTQTLHRFAVPLHILFKKHNYSWLKLLVIGTHEVVSPNTRSLLACNTAVTITEDGKAEGLDRRNEELVKDLSSFPGERAKSEVQVCFIIFLFIQVSKILQSSIFNTSAIGKYS